MASRTIAHLCTPPYALAVIITNITPVYDSDVHGLTYDACCAHAHGHAKTLTFVTVGDNKFGGFVDKPFATRGVWVESKAAFLFAVVNPAGPSPQLFPVKSEKRALCCDFRFAINFGSDDLSLVPSYNGGKSGSTFPTFYSGPGEARGGYFTGGSTRFTPTRVQVFSCQ